MKRKVINKNNKRLQNRFDQGGWEDTAKSIAMTNPYGAMAVGFDSLAQGVSNKANEMFGGQAYDDNPDWINEGIYGDSSGTHIGKMWSKNKTLDETVDKIEDYGNQGFSSQTNEGLVNEYQNTDFLKESNISGLALDMSDVIDNLFDPGSSLLRGIAGIFGNRQKTARERQDEINDAIREANKRKIASFNSRIRQVQNRQKFLDMQNMFGFGGFFDSPYIDGAIDYDFATKDLDIKRMNALAKNKVNALPSSSSGDEVNIFAGGGKIYIKPSKRGTFTAAAKKRGMGVQEFASKVLANKENYSPAMVKKANFARNAAKWKHAFGGDLNSNGSIFDLGYTNIGNGNTHEDNIYGGVPVSMDAQGIPNLVEEGEVIWNDYVFSNRLKNPKTGRTFARDAKKAQQESKERPNDPISKRGLEVAYTKLANEQEAIRQETATKKASSKAHKFAGDTEDGSTIETVDWSTYNPNPWYNAMRQSTVIPGIVGLINPPKAYSYKVPKSREVNYIPLGDLMQYTPFDTDYRTAQLQAEAVATRRALLNSGNLLSPASILAADYNSQLNLGNLARQAAEYNLAQKQAVAQFNRGTRQANQEAALNAAIANQKRDLQQTELETAAERYYQDQLDKVYAAKMGNLSNIFNNLGKIGQDYRNSYDARWAARYLPGGYTIKFGG